MPTSGVGGETDPHKIYEMLLGRGWTPLPFVTEKEATKSANRASNAWTPMQQGDLLRLLLGSDPSISFQYLPQEEGGHYDPLGREIVVGSGDTAFDTNRLIGEHEAVHGFQDKEFGSSILGDIRNRLGPIYEAIKGRSPKGYMTEGKSNKILAEWPLSVPSPQYLMEQQADFISGSRNYKQPNPAENMLLRTLTDQLFRQQINPLRK